VERAFALSTASRPRTSGRSPSLRGLAPPCTDSTDRMGSDPRSTTKRGTPRLDLDSVRGGQDSDSSEEGRSGKKKDNKKGECLIV
jgi:hypothetical protein